MQPALRSTLDSTLVAKRILAPYELSNLKTLFGRRALRAVAVQSCDPGTARERPIYVHQYNKDGEVESRKYTYGDEIKVTDITYFSYDDFVPFDKRYAAREHGFTNSGRVCTGGEECIKVNKYDMATLCCICYSKIDLSDDSTLFTPTSKNKDTAAWAGYIMSVSSGRGVCNDCVNAGFLNEGTPVDTFQYLKPKLSHEPVMLGCLDKRIDPITAHAAKRIPRLGINVHVRDDELAELNWYSLKDSTALVTEEDDYIGQKDDHDREVVPGERTILVAEVDSSIWINTYRKFNCTGVIYMAAVAVDVDDTGSVIYKALTILPSIYSKDIRFTPEMHRAQVLRVPDDQGTYALDEGTAIRLINSWTYIVRDSYDYTKELGSLAEVIYSVSNEYDVKPYFLMSVYVDRRCYACHRSWRGDVGMQCCGTICPYSGRFPITEGRVLSSALVCFLTKGGPGFRPAIVGGAPGEKGPDTDEYILRNATRCELSGSAFVCTNAHGGLMRPKVRVTIGGACYNCCVACFLRYQCAGRIDSYDAMPAHEQDEKYYTVRVTDRALYQASLTTLFSGIEVPTVFPKSSAFAYGMLNDGDSVSSMLSYIASAQGSESVLACAYSVNKGSGVVEIDAWDSQSGMSIDTKVTASSKPQEALSVTLSHKNKPEGLLGHLGVESAVMEFRGVKSEYTNNTRFLIRNSMVNTTYTPVVNDEVNKGLSGWLSHMPKSYILSVAHTLAHYRSALKSVLDYKRGVVTKPMIGSDVVEDTYLRDVCAELLTWGLNSSQKMFASIFVPDRFGIGGTKANTATKMREVDQQLAQKLVTWTIQYFKVNKDARMKPDVWRAEIIGDAVGCLTKTSSYEPSYMADVRSMVEKMQLASGKKLVTTDKNKIKDSAMALTKRSVLKGGKYVLTRCSEAGLPTRPQRVFRDIWEENFLYINEKSPVVSDDSRKFSGIGHPKMVSLPTPPFIWGEAGRSPISKPKSFAATLSQISGLLKEYTMRNSGDNTTMNAYYDQLKTCYIVWDNGPVIRFPGSSVEMRWGDNLRMSTLLATRMVTSIQQGPSSELVVTLRETQTNALDIMRCERFGSL